jgi:hypothetical protein
MAGKQGQELEVNDLYGKDLVKKGLAVELDAPKPKAAKRKTKVKKPTEDK